MEDNGILSKKETLKYLWKYLTLFKKDFFKIMIATILSTILCVTTPYFMAYIIDHFLIFEKKKIFLLVSLLFCFYLFYIILSRFSTKRMLKVEEASLFKIRKDLFSSLQNLPISYFDNHQKGDLMSRFTSDMEQISDSLSETFIDIIVSILTFFGTLILMFSMNFNLSIAILFTVPLFFIGALKIGIKAGEYFTKQQEEVGILNGYFEEHVTGSSVIKAFSIEKDIKKEFDLKNKNLKDTQRKAIFWSNLIVPLNTLVSNIGNIFVLIYGSYLVMDSKLTVGMLLAFLSYADMFRSPIQNLASIFSSLQSSLAGANRIFSIIDEEKKCKFLDGKGLFPNFKQIHFKNVSFKYDTKPVLSNISFSLKRGETVAIVGETGSGKTTLVQLLLRLYEIEEGSILIDEKDIKEISISSFYHKIGVILQEPFLFEGTILENVLYGNPNAHTKKAIKALKEAGADFVERIPNQYNYKIEENGSNLSSGEKQLIAIARTILQDPDILILDEATSNVDLFTEKKVYDSMMQLMKKKTTIVIAHRLKTIEQANRIIFLEKGTIKEEGTHKQLLDKKGKYYALYMSQFS